MVILLSETNSFDWDESNAKIVLQPVTRRWMVGATLRKPGLRTSGQWVGAGRLSNSLQAFHGLHRLEGIVVDAGGVQAAALLEGIDWDVAGHIGHSCRR
jgi:hypothetical protein